MGKIKPILNLSWAMAPLAMHSEAEAIADRINARFFIEGVSKGKVGSRFWAGCKGVYFKLLGFQRCSDTPIPCAARIARHILQGFSA